MVLLPIQTATNFVDTLAVTDSRKCQLRSHHLISEEICSLRFMLHLHASIDMRNQSLSTACKQHYRQPKNTKAELEPDVLKVHPRDFFAACRVFMPPSLRCMTYRCYFETSIAHWGFERCLFYKLSAVKILFGIKLQWWTAHAKLNIELREVISVL